MQMRLADALVIMGIICRKTLVGLLRASASYCVTGGLWRLPEDDIDHIGLFIHQTERKEEVAQLQR